jgi:transcriptional regulator with XRE-family HTH domain
MARSLPQPFHQILKRERRKHGWTQSALAELLGIDANTVSRWERGSHVPFPIFRTKLSELFGIPLEELGLLDEEPEGIAPLLLSYAQADELFATRLKQDLASRELRLLSDEARDLPASERQEAVRKALQEAHALLLIASPQSSTEPSVQEDLSLAEQAGCPVCVLWMAGRRRQDVLPPLQTAVRALDLIDARPPRYERALDALLTRLGTLPPPSFRDADTLPTFEPRNPYKGLRAFGYEDAHDFFGRERLVDALVDALEQQLARAEQQAAARFLAVVGPSGSGKSSVVLAGLLPRLHLDELPGSRRWVYLPPMVPGKHPLEALSATLGHALPERSFLSIREDLEEESGRGLHVLATQLVTPTAPTVVLVVDQCEELFTQTTDEWERQHFIKLLVTASTEPSGPLLLLLTLRGDFYDRPMYYPELGSLIEQQSKSVFPMNRQELRAAIEKPATLADVQVTFEEHVIGNLLAEVQEQPGALPLLQFVLEQLFEQRQGHHLTLSAYHEMGGVRGALAKHAEDTYAALPSEEHRRLARVLFLRLLDPGKTEQELTRRRAERGEFSLDDAEETRLLNESMDAFIAARLLTTSQSGATTMIEVSHEALLREWPRLMEWLREAREDVYLQQAISRDVAAWERSGKPRDRLYRGSQLREASAWGKRTAPSKREAAFLRASTTHHLHALVLRIAIVLLLLATTGLVSWLALLVSANPTLVTTLADAGSGSLRQAIEQARGSSTITFAPNLRGSILLTSGDLTFSRNLTLRGPGAGVLTLGSGTKGYGIQVLAGVSVAISGLTLGESTLPTADFIQNAGTLDLSRTIVAHVTTLGSGRAPIHNLISGTLTLTNCTVSGNTSASSAGGIHNEGQLSLISSIVSQNTGGGIVNNTGEDSTVSVTKSTIAENSTDGPGGGGIYNGGTLHLTSSLLTGNRSTIGPGGGIYNLFGTMTITASTISDNTATHSYGGGIENQADLTITGSTIADNTSSDNVEPHRGGGGIYNSGGTLSITSSLIAHNTLLASAQSGNSGGGIYNSGVLTLTDSTIAYNTATGGPGGGISNDFGSTLTLVNSTIVGNTSTDDAGGGISTTGGRTFLVFCTVYGNTAHSYGGGIFTAAGSPQQVPGQFEMTNSLVAQNRAESLPDVAGVLLSGGYNLIGEPTGFSVVPANGKPGTDLIGQEAVGLRIDPQLQEQSGPAGPAWVLALLQGSSAIDRIPMAFCHPGGITTDQRGVKRPQGPACDIGAYEYSTEVFTSERLLAMPGVREGGIL